LHVTQDIPTLQAATGGKNGTFTVSSLEEIFVETGLPRQIGNGPKPYSVTPSLAPEGNRGHGCAYGFDGIPHPLSIFQPLDNDTCGI